MEGFLICKGLCRLELLLLHSGWLYNERKVLEESGVLSVKSMPQKNDWL